MGEFYSTGLRCLKSIVINTDGVLYGISQGRDSLHELYPQFFTREQGIVLAPDELVKIDRNTNFGFPYCYTDSVSGRRKLLGSSGAGTLAKRPAALGPVQAAGEEELLVGDVQAAGAHGFWIWATIDNLTVGGAGNIVRLAEQLLRPGTAS